MKRQEQVQKLFDEFEPFDFLYEYKRKMNNETLKRYQTFLEKLNTTKKIKVILEIPDEWEKGKMYEVNVTDGLKKFVYNMIEFENKCLEDYDAHATEGSLYDEDEKRMNVFFSSLFNKRLKEVVKNGAINLDEDAFYYRYDNIESDENYFEVSFFDDDQEFIRFVV